MVPIPTACSATRSRWKQTMDGRHASIAIHWSPEPTPRSFFRYVRRVDCLSRRRRTRLARLRRSRAERGRLCRRSGHRTDHGRCAWALDLARAVAGVSCDADSARRTRELSHPAGNEETAGGASISVASLVRTSESEPSTPLTRVSNRSTTRSFALSSSASLA